MKQKHYAIYQVGGPIYGVGLNEELAKLDAEIWLENKEIIEERDYNEDEYSQNDLTYRIVILHEDNQVDGNLCIAECSETIYNKVQSTGGNFRYINEGIRPYNCLYL